MDDTPRQDGAGDSRASTFGELLRMARHRARLSQRALAERAGVPKSTVGRIECDQIDPRLSVVRGLVEATGCWLVLVDQLGCPLESLRTESLRDRGGRRFPAHVDLRRAIWGHWWPDDNLSRQHRDRPDHTFDRSPEARGARPGPGWHAAAAITGLPPPRQQSLPPAWRDIDDDWPAAGQGLA